MDNLFKSRVLTASVNEIKTDVPMKIYDRLFRPKEHLEDSSLIAFDIIFGSERLLPNLKVTDEATVTSHTGRKTVTVEAGRLADKRLIPAAYFDKLRGYGEQFKRERASVKIAREQNDMKGEHDRTLEFWAASAIQGVIYDSDLTTELVNYNVDATHKPVLAGGDLWSDPDNSYPLRDLAAWRRLIKRDAKAVITEWIGYCGENVMPNLLKNKNVLSFLSEKRLDVIATETDTIERLGKVELVEYDDYFEHTDGTLKQAIDANTFVLIGVCEEVVDAPFAPVIDMEQPGLVGNITSEGEGLMFFSKSWPEKDPSGRWVKNEARPLLVLKRPGAVIVATVTA